jgi:hypothetical protein
MVLGSTGQRRAHPLLKLSGDLRREIADGLKELTFRVGQREVIEQMNELSRGLHNLTAEEVVALAVEAFGAVPPAADQD